MKLLALLLLASPASGAFLHSRSITIDHTKCGASNTIMPVLVSINDSTFKLASSGGLIQNVSSFDVIFTSDSLGATKIPWEVELGANTAGTFIAWVLTTCNHTSDTVFYVFFDDATISTAQNTGANGPTHVWSDGAVSYIMVQHLNQASNGLAVDSTSNHNDSSSTHTSTQITAKIGFGQSFNGTSQVITGSLSATTNYTWSSWINAAATGFSVFPETRGITGFGIIITTRIATGLAQFFANAGGTVNSTAVAADSTWHYVVCTVAGTAIKVYVDNNAAQTGSFSPDNSWSGWKLAQDFLNNFYAQSNDEFRQTNVAIGADQILSEFNNQNNPGNIGTPGFLTFGPQNNFGSVHAQHRGIWIL